MKEIILTIGSLIGVVAAIVLFVEWVSQPSAAEIQNIQRNLPAGCQFHDLGSYGDINHVIAVTCDGRKTSANSHIEYHGKYSRQGLSVTIDG